MISQSTVVPVDFPNTPKLQHMSISDGCRDHNGGHPHGKTTVAEWSGESMANHVQDRVLEKPENGKRRQCVFETGSKDGVPNSPQSGGRLADPMWADMAKPIIDDHPTRPIGEPDLTILETRSPRFGVQRVRMFRI